jgi:ADP-ribose pyrophosphatase YjhB (NUDIX family)
MINSKDNRMTPTKPTLIVDAFIKKENKYLAVKRKKIEDGTWETPGGRVEFGERIEDALKREIKEETGFNVEIGKFLGWGEGLNCPHKDGFGVHRFILYFDCEIVSGELRIGSEEAYKHKWVTWNEFKKLKPLSRPIKDFFNRFG